MGSLLHHLREHVHAYRRAHRDAHPPMVHKPTLTPAEWAGFLISLAWLFYVACTFALIGWFGFVINPVVGVLIWVGVLIAVAVPFLPFLVPRRR